MQEKKSLYNNIKARANILFLLRLSAYIKEQVSKLQKMPSRKLSKTKWDQTDSPPQGHHDQTDAGKAPGRKLRDTRMSKPCHTQNSKDNNGSRLSRLRNSLRATTTSLTRAWHSHNRIQCSRKQALKRDIGRKIDGEGNDVKSSNPNSERRSLYVFLLCV